MHRLTRYSIRSLLVLVTLACVVLGWYAMNVRAYRAERAALARLEEVHGKIHVRTQDIRLRRCHIIPPSDAAGCATMEHVGAFSALGLPGSYDDAFLRVTELTLDVKASDLSGFEPLRRLPYLTTVYIDGTHLSKAERERVTEFVPNVTFDFGMMEFMDAQLELEFDESTEESAAEWNPVSINETNVEFD